MEQKKDKMDVLLKSLIKMGELPPEDKLTDYLRDLPSQSDIPNAVRERTIARLEKRQRELKETKKRLQSPEKLNSMGEYLRLKRIKERSDTMDSATEAQIDANKLNLFENDGISPLDFTVDEMARLVLLVGLGTQVAIALIRKSHQLFKMRPQLSKASARYTDRQGMPESKIGDMDRALKELILKSSGRRAGALSDPELENYLKDLQVKLG
jgi:hypothetical protein